MKYRRTQHKKVIKSKNLLLSLLAFLIILGLSLVISSNVASFIYKGTNYNVSNSNESEIDSTSLKQNSVEVVKDSEEKLKAYADNLQENSMIVFQGGVFNDLENAEEFKSEINDKTLASIINDGKYERVILGISTKENFLDYVNLFRDNNIQFVKQVYKIPTNVDYNKELLDVIGLFSNFVLENYKQLNKDNIDVTKLKNDVEKISADYGQDGSYKTFNTIKEIILELDDKCSKEDLESILDFTYNNFKPYKY